MLTEKWTKVLINALIGHVSGYRTNQELGIRVPQLQNYSMGPTPAKHGFCNFLR